MAMNSFAFTFVSTVKPNPDGVVYNTVYSFSGFLESVDYNGDYRKEFDQVPKQAFTTGFHLTYFNGLFIIVTILNYMAILFTP